MPCSAGEGAVKCPDLGYDAESLTGISGMEAMSNLSRILFGMLEKQIAQKKTKRGLS